MSETRGELPNKEQFLAHVDSTFRATLDDGQIIDLRFLRLDPGISTPTQESFSLIFKVPLDTPPVQGLFHLEHDKLDAIDLFLVPVNQKEDGLIFEAVINRLLV